MKKIIFSLITALFPLSAWGIGYVYTGVGGGGRELLELTSVTVDVKIQDRVAVTRTDQTFTNRSDNTVEGIYEFALPPGAIITDLVLWIGERRVQGIIMEKQQARQTYDQIVGRRIDPALVEQVDERHFRLSIFPFPAQGSRRVELEYTQVLEARRGLMRYTFPLAPETSQSLRMETFILKVAVRGQHPFAVEAAQVFAQGIQVEQKDSSSANLFYGDEGVSPTQDFALTIRETGERRLPTVLSFSGRSAGEPGYYALWLPPLQELADSAPIPRSLTFVIDISSSMLGTKIAAVKGALSAAIADLHSDDLFNIIVFSNKAASFAENPVPATEENKQTARTFIQQQGAFGLTNFEASLQMALQQSFPGGSLNHVIFLTDGYPTVGEKDLARLSQLVDQLAGEVRLFTIGVGSDVNRDFLRALAEDHRGSSSSLSAEGDIEVELRRLFEEFSRPIFLPTDLAFAQMETSDFYPRGIELLSTGQELFQVGRYTGGGEFTLKLTGRLQDRSLTLEYPLRFAQADTAQPLIPRLWAHQKVQALEDQIARFGQQQELLDDILRLGLDYRLVTRMTSLFAPDDNIIVNPELEAEAEDGAATAVEEELATASWLGKDFYLRDDTWIDAQFNPLMTVHPYDPRVEQPVILAQFAQLDQHLIVVAEGEAYEILPGILPLQPVLQQNWPNPFNASTLIRFHVPAGMETAPLRLAVYNLAGQAVRVLAAGVFAPGEQQVAWDGRDETGHESASGVYVYRLEGEGFAVTRRMLLLR